MTTRTPWQRKADERWPDAMDMVDRAYGNGRWATVAWCAGLTVDLHLTEKSAIDAINRIDATGCGHSCWRDHELVDLAEQPEPDPEHEFYRGHRRAAHLEACRVCIHVFDGKAPAAAMVRAKARGGDG